VTTNRVAVTVSSIHTCPQNPTYGDQIYMIEVQFFVL
jgi:hypothetical protein